MPTVQTLTTRAATPMTRITRLAPSPTGALHLGNARTFLINWLLARQAGWRIILRIDDLDGPRVKAGADRQTIDDLHWLGLDWDQGPIYQSTRTELYRAAAARLLDANLAYPCVCSRREAELASSAPHAEDGAAVYPGTCRGRYASIEEAKQAGGRAPALRFEVPEGIVAFNDEFCGPQRIEPGRFGDFVIQKGDGTSAYHLAVVVDDAAMNVTDVVRGDDLLDSAARQILLYNALGLAERIPRWWHLPLVVGGDGRRLAKRHGDTRLSYYRQRGVTVNRILALLARWCGVECGDETDLHHLRGRFEIGRVSKEPIIFSPDDDRWLLNRKTGS
jgi:glutamyl-tRNA synthetase